MTASGRRLVAFPVGPLIVASLLALSGPGCAPPGGEDDAAIAPDDTSTLAPPVPDGRTGILLRSDAGALEFEPCSGDPLPVTDNTGEDLDELFHLASSPAGGVQLHAVVDAGVLEEIRVAVPEAPSCSEILPDARIEGRGNEPFWNLQVEGDELVFRSPEELDGIRHAEGQWVDTEENDTWRFEAHGAWIEFVAERCLDTMSGAWYPFRTLAEHDGRSLEGCGLEGRRHSEGLNPAPGGAPTGGS